MKVGFRVLLTYQLKVHIIVLLRSFGVRTKSKTVPLSFVSLLLSLFFASWIILRSLSESTGTLFLMANFCRTSCASSSLSLAINHLGDSGTTLRKNTVILTELHLEYQHQRRALPRASLYYFSITFFFSICILRKRQQNGLVSIISTK